MSYLLFCMLTQNISRISFISVSCCNMLEFSSALDDAILKILSSLGRDAVIFAPISLHVHVARITYFCEHRLLQLHFITNCTELH